MQTENSLLRLSGDQIIELIREHRNDLINKLLPQDFLKSYLSKSHDLDHLSSTKLEFIQRALQQLTMTPVDLSHYAALILEIRKKDLAVISKSHELFFYQDIEKAIKNYL